MARRKRTPEQLNRERIRKVIKRGERRGYVFEGLPDFKQLDLEALKVWTPDELYRHASYVVPDTGEVVSGQTGRTLERREASRKGAITKRINKGLESISPDEIAEHERALRLKEVDRVISGIYSLIDEIPTEVTRTYYYTPKRNNEARAQKEYTAHQKVQGKFAESVNTAKGKLTEIVDKAIALYGREAVAKAYQENAIEINAIIEYFYHYGHEGAVKAGDATAKYARFATLLNAGPLSSAEMKDMNDIEPYTDDEYEE